MRTSVDGLPEEDARAIARCRGRREHRERVGGVWNGLRATTDEPALIPQRPASLRRLRRRSVERQTRRTGLAHPVPVADRDRSPVARRLRREGDDGGVTPGWQTQFAE